jgi:hypothetical protein
MQNENNNMLVPLKIVDDYECGELSYYEMLNELCKFCWRYPAERDKLFDYLLEYPMEKVNEVALEIQEMIRNSEKQSNDLNQIRKTSPLQPGVVLFLGGGYDAAYSNPWWLNGQTYYRATFKDFVDRGADKMPAAFIELEEEIDLTEGSGLRHWGRFALLKLTFVANWDETETVQVHIVDALPADVEAFYSAHDFGSEIESHATYRIANNEGE